MANSREPTHAIGELRRAFRESRNAAHAVTVSAIHRVVEAERRRIDVEVEVGVANLTHRVRAYDAVGVAPSLMHLVGEASREVPYNRVLGWLCDPLAGHGAGPAVSRAIADAADHESLVAALDADEPYQVLVETGWPYSVGAYGAPDLLIWTSGSVLVLENKVNSGESQASVEVTTSSGETTRRQYALYLDGAKRLRADGMDVSLVLTSRDLRERPEGWDIALSHADVADMLDSVSCEARIPEWGRVCCRVVAEAFRHDRRTELDLAEARSLLERARLGQLTMRDAQRLTRLAESLPLPQSPWRTE